MICGDFNEGHDGSAVRWLRRCKFKSKNKHLKDSCLKDALYECIPSAKTWFWPLKFGLTIKGAYDHIFYTSEGLTTVQCSVMSKYDLVSDHSPVFAKFIFSRSECPAQPEMAALERLSLDENYLQDEGTDRIYIMNFGLSGALTF